MLQQQWRLHRTIVNGLPRVCAPAIGDWGLRVSLLEYFNSKRERDGTGWSVSTGPPYGVRSRKDRRRGHRVLSLARFCVLPLEYGPLRLKRLSRLRALQAGRGLRRCVYSPQDVFLRKTANISIYRWISIRVVRGADRSTVRAPERSLVASNQASYGRMVVWSRL